MRIVFAGTPPFAAQALKALTAAGHDIVLVLTQPDRPSGRGLKKGDSAVKAQALEAGLTVFQPPTLRDPAAISRLLEAAPDILVVAAYGLILPREALDLPPYGAVNIHASLLPRWRGAAPIQRALLAGDRATGISIMQMDAGLDTGAVLSMRSLPIEDRDTAGSLHDKLAALGSEMIVEALTAIARGEAHAVPQPGEGVTYASKISKEEARLDWRRPALELDRVIRAFNPVPGAVATMGATDIKIWRARICGDQGAPGRVLDARESGILVACGEGALSLQELQRTGGKRLGAREFLNGFPLVDGAMFEIHA